MGKIALLRRNWLLILIAFLTIGIIAFAFIWEAMGTVEMPQQKSDGVDIHRSAVQELLNELEWVTIDFLPVNEYSRPGERLRRVDTIVIHNIGNPGTSAQQNRNWFSDLSETGETYASSNFIIGLEGEIIQCVPVDEIAYASNQRNDDTLSIEVCHPDDTGQFGYATYESTVRLTAWLCGQYKIRANELLRHYDVSGKECPRYYVINEGAWELFKLDVAAAMTDDTTT